jgi:ADP-heptose:LPS heptosyltransferase
VALTRVEGTRPRVLALRALGLGDFCTAVPALRALRHAYPEHELVLAAPAWQAPLARLAHVDRFASTQALAPLPRRETAPEVAVNLHGRGPQSTRSLIDIAPDRLICYRHPVVPETDHCPRWSHDEHEVARWCRLLDTHGIAADPNQLDLDRPNARPVAEGAVVVHPGAAAGSRRWPATRFTAVVRRLIDENQRVVITGTTDETPIADEIVAGAGTSLAGGLLNSCGRTTIDELCATVASARAVISNDTGVAHLAYAYRIPSVVLFGPSRPDRWGPPPGPHVALWSGHTGDPHADQLDAGLATITPADVLDALDSVI